MRIGLDLDGVIVDWVGNARRMLRDRGSNISFEDPPYWDWLKEQANPEDWRWLWGSGMKMSYQSAMPYPFAVAFAKALRRLGDVVIMTSRPEGSWTATIQWWHDYIGYTPAGYNFFHTGIAKANVYVDAFIEDNAEYAEHYANAYPFSSEVFLLTRSWNAGYNVPMDGNLHRASGYQDILKEIERLKNEKSK